MVFGKKKDATSKDAAKKAAEVKTPTVVAPVKEEPKKAVPKNDLATKLREQKAKREAEEKEKNPEVKSSNDNKAAVTQQNATVDKDWDAKLKEIMKETGEDVSAPRPKARVIIKPDGTKSYVYDSAYGADVSHDDKSATKKDDKSSTKSNEEPVKKQVKSVTPAENGDDMKGFDDFYKWVKNGQMADMRDCEKVMFGK